MTDEQEYELPFLELESDDVLFVVKSDGRIQVVICDPDDRKSSRAVLLAQIARMLPRS